MIKVTGCLCVCLSVANDISKRLTDIVLLKVKLLVSYNLLKSDKKWLTIIIFKILLFSSLFLLCRWALFWAARSCACKLSCLILLCFLLLLVVVCWKPEYLCQRFPSPEKVKAHIPSQFSADCKKYFLYLPETGSYQSKINQKRSHSETTMTKYFLFTIQRRREVNCYVNVMFSKT